MVWGLLTAAAAADVLTLDPARSFVSFRLGATFHTVKGRIPVESGRIEFDPAGGAASGEIVLDATRSTSDHDARDRKMHQHVLETAAFPRIVFRPRELRVVERPSPDEANVELSGTLEIRGLVRPLLVEGRVWRDTEGTHVSCRFPAPYVAWGLKDMSNFLLKVKPVVEVDFEALGVLSSHADAPASR